jgi:hypothetical protein
MKKPGEFQTTHDPNTGLLDGMIEAEVFEEDPPQPTNIIKTDKGWYVQVDWTLEGEEVPCWAGMWNLQAHLETMGPGTDISHPAPPKQIALNQGTTYSEQVRFPPDTVPAGAYKLVVTLTYDDIQGEPGPLAAYVEGPMLQFYEP